MLWNQEWLQCVQVMWYMLYATPTRHMIPSHRHHTHHAPTAPVNTPPSRHNCPAQDSTCKGCGKRVTGKQNAAALAPLVCKHPIINPSSKVAKRGQKGERITSCQSQNREKTPTQRPVCCCNELQNSRRHAPKGDDHQQHQFPAGAMKCTQS